MGLDASVLERQLASAEARLGVCVEALKGAGVAQKEWKRCPDWRQADAGRRQAKRRLSAAQALRAERVSDESADAE